MDTIFFWMIAGATMALLGVFLIASERELKTKRRELEELKNKIAEGPAPANGSTAVYPHESETSAELVARNEALVKEVSALSQQLEASESNLAQIKTLREHLNSTEAENSELRADRERLRSELSTVTTKMEFNAPPASDAAGDVQNEARIAELNEQLETSQAKIRDLEGSREQLADAESQHKAFEELQKSLEVSTLQLQNALAAEQEKQKALETVQMQLSGIEQSYQELNETNLRLREENSQLQQQLSQNQQQADRSLVIRQRLEELQSKHADIVEQDRLIQEEMAAMSRSLDIVSEETSHPQALQPIHYDQSFQVTANEPIAMHGEDLVEETSFRRSDTELRSSSNNIGGGEDNETASAPMHHNSVSVPPAIAASTPATSNYATPAMERNKRRFGIFPTAVAVLVVGGALAAGFFGNDSEQKSAASREHAAKLETLAAAKSSNAAHRESGQNSGTPDDKGLSVESRLTKTPEKATTAIAASGKPSPTAWESYEIIQPTRVFSAPREDSQLIANVEPGTLVNVVDSRNGWLEIRSKHGRPPGFIPRASATRIGQN
jgi:regulator of replication initiation timing